jgi:class 3 adenylate cyclase/tetratricopeptide (TPR) repeat protein
VIVCPSCSETNPDNARFCVSCGSPLAERPPDEERKLVTVVFAELLGLESAGDPEDLRRALEPYHALVGRIVANHGGTIDKFMGSTVLCVFGAPVAHEDDPERGVRVALRIRERVAEMGLSVRLGVNTGEAVVALPGSGPQIGEAVTGDVVNTASRLQTAAGPGEVLVGQPTHDATALVFDWTERDPVRVKGKTEPQRVWLALAPRSRFGFDVRTGSSSPFIGRKDQLGQLRFVFQRAVAESTVQLVTITGQAGIGKSRLIQELSNIADEWPNLVRWRQGRSLPYGEGLGLWPLGEMVRADAGILESDTAEEADAKLRQSIEPYVPAAEREWLRARLAPLARAERTGVELHKEELFNAWRRWFEALASDSPFVVVFEDLHWADDVLLEFVEHLVDWAAGLPLMVVCAARPELYERHPSWGGRQNSTAIALPPLSRQETSMLLGALLERIVLPPSTQLELLERSGGNPLYAEEYVRMLRDRGVIEEGTVVGPVEMPPSVHQLIGARIDTLPPTEKDVLQDAAVVGKVFWSGAVEAVSGLPEDVVVRALRESVKREFIRRVRPSSFQGQEEYAFNHLLVQEVTYGQIPRAGRASRHVAVARWIRAAAGERVYDVAELLAHHYGEALRHTKAMDPKRNVAGLEAATGAALMMSGDRAKRIDAGRAVILYRRARLVLANDDPERRRALLEAAEAAEEAGRLAEAETDFDAAIEEYRASGDRLGLGEALARRARSIRRHGAAARALLEEAVSILETEPPGPELARATTRMAGHLFVSGDNDAAAGWAERALALADDLGIEDEAVLALQYRGAARAQVGDREGLDDLREALRRGLELGLGNEVATTYNNLAYLLWFWEGSAAALPVWEEMSAFCQVRGFDTMAMWAEAGRIESLFDAGRWDEVLETSNRLRAWVRERQPTRIDIEALAYHAWVHLRRGDLDAAAEDVEELLPMAREIAYAEYIAPSLMIATEVSLARGDRDDALAYLRELEAAIAHSPEYLRMFGPLAVRTLLSVGLVGEAARYVEEPSGPLRVRLSMLTSAALVAEARGDHDAAAVRYAEAVAGWAQLGFGLEEARSRIEYARCLQELGREADSRAELERARELLEPLGARPFLEEIGALL